MIAELAEQGLPPASIASRLVGELRAAPQSHSNAGIRIAGVESSSPSPMDKILADLKTMIRDLDNELRELYTRKCARRIGLVLVDHFADATLVDFDHTLVQARRSRQLTRQQFDDVRVVDIIAQGTPDDGDAPILAVIATSLSINQQDVRNAHRRAGMIQELMGRTAAALCVAHYRWSDDLTDIAAGLGVALIHYELPGFDIP